MENYPVHIEAKITKPKPIKNLIKRKKLNAFLERSTESLVVFHAAIGYGKTVFMNEWKADRPEIKKAWYHISYMDNDLIVFMEYLADTVKRQLSDFSFPLDSYREMEDERYVCERMSAEFCQTLGQVIAEDADTESLIIILDDFQEIVTDRIKELIERILQYLPEHVRFFISTKGSLPWFTDRQKLQGDALVVTAGDLAFDEEETEELAAEMRVLAATDGFFSCVWEYTEGWPAGVMLICQYVRQNQGRMIFSRDSMVHMDQETRIQEFLMYHLFRKLSCEIQSFLKGTALLEYLNSSICNAIMGIDNSAGILNYMMQEGLFIQRIEGKVQTYRYHSLFRRFVINQLSEKDKKNRLNQIALFFLNKRWMEQAAEYAILADNGKILNRVVACEGAGILQDGGMERIGRWLEVLTRKDCFTSRSSAIAGMYYWKLGRRKLADVCFCQGRELAAQSENINDYLFVLKTEVKILQESGRYGEASGLLIEAMENRVKRYGASWFELACQEVVNQLNLLEEEKASRLLNEMIREKETGSCSLKTASIKELAEKLLSVLHMDGIQDWEEEEKRLEGCFCRFPVSRELFLWKRISAPEMGKNLTYPHTEDWLKQLKPTAKSSVWGICSRILLGYWMYRQGQGVKGGLAMTEGMLELKKRGFSVSLSGEEKRVCQRFYIHAKAGGCLEEGVYHLIAECFGDFCMYVLETGEKISWRTKKARECVALFLHLHPRHLSREELLEMLWDEEEMPKQEVAALHNLLSSIRKSLLPYHLEALIQYEDKKYYLKEEYIASDIPHIRRVIGMVRDRREDEVWEEKEGIWEYRRKPYLSGVDRLWAREERSYLERWMYEALMMIGGTAMSRQDFREAEKWYFAAMEAEPFLEMPVLCVFRCLGKQKDIQSLHLVYRRRKELMEKELGEKLTETVEAAYQKGLKECGNALFVP